jgi:hypothetical protein
MYIESRREGTKVHHIEMLGGGLSLLDSPFRQASPPEFLGLSVGDWATWIGNGLVLVSVLAVFIQLRLSLQSHRAEVRPYVVAFVYEGLTAQGKPAVYLALENQGESAALDVKVSCDFTAPWYFVKSPDYPFERRDGIPVISPKVRLSYFLGPLGVTSPLTNLYQGEVEVRVSYRAAAMPKIKPDAYRLTLNNKFGRMENIDRLAGR